MVRMSQSTATCAVLTASEAHALLRDHCLHSTGEDRAPAQLPPACYRLGNDNTMQRTVHPICPAHARPNRNPPVPRREVLTIAEADALLRRHIFYSPDADRAPAQLPSARYRVGNDNLMQREIHPLPPVTVVPVHSASDDHVRHTHRRHSYPPCPRRNSVPLW
ncbi:hypothetical protein B0H17DRAFT_1210687 [Mycena rosella]|uniref:Uncharacterized protein n=1 Tax=Mycena rosella TaxID=1033263 RepID=A0AAD7CWX0_MYCRO|nr:hypothetical protein B0H17DRAFT_1210687 [Mycena rosella]